MPTRFALMRTASNNSSGSRRLIDVSLRFNSKRIGTIPEKSYSLRSAATANQWKPTPNGFAAPYQVTNRKWPPYLTLADKTFTIR